MLFMIFTLNLKVTNVINARDDAKIASAFRLNVLLLLWLPFFCLVCYVFDSTFVSLIYLRVRYSVVVVVVIVLYCRSHCLIFKSFFAGICSNAYRCYGASSTLWSIGSCIMCLLIRSFGTRCCFIIVIQLLQQQTGIFISVVVRNWFLMFNWNWFCRVVLCFAIGNENNNNIKTSEKTNRITARCNNNNKKSFILKVKVRLIVRIHK